MKRPVDIRKMTVTQVPQDSEFVKVASHEVSLDDWKKKRARKSGDKDVRHGP